MGGKSVAGLCCCVAAVERGGDADSRRAAMRIRRGRRHGRGDAPCEVARLGNWGIYLQYLDFACAIAANAALALALTLIAKGFDRVLVGRLVGRIQPEDEADGGGKPYR